MEAERGGAGLGLDQEGDLVRINFWCGGRILDGWLNVDGAHRNKDVRGPDLLHAVQFAPDGSIVNPLPLPDGCAEELQAIHAAEHVHQWELPFLIAEWHRLLKPGGLLVLELPDLHKFCHNILQGKMVGGKHPDQLGMWAAWGDPRGKDPWMTHKWGYTFKTLAPIVMAAGFEKPNEHPTRYHPAGREFRDLRLEARKPANG